MTRLPSCSAMPSCRYCGCWHNGTCPKVKAIEYHPDGSVRRVELHENAAGDLALHGEAAERVEAARLRIERVLVRLVAMERAPATFPTERRLLQEALDLLNPEVKLA